MQFLTFVSKSALARVIPTATPFGKVVAVASLVELEACMRSLAESCVIVDPALLSVEGADSLSRAAVDFSKAVIAYTSLTPSTMQTAVILAACAGAQFVYQGIPDERSALVRTLVAVPGPEFGRSLITALSPQLGRLTPPLREVVTAMLRTGSGSLNAVGLASRSGIARRTMDRSVVSAGFKSTRLLIAAARIVRSYRAITSTRTSFKRIATAVGYASQRPLDRECRHLLGQSCASLRQAPLPIPQAVDMLVSRIVKSYDCTVTIKGCEKCATSPQHVRRYKATQQPAHNDPIERASEVIIQHGMIL